MRHAMIPVARPRLPTAGHIAPYLKEIDANQWYSNFGPISSRLQARLAEHWALAKPEVLLCASGTVAITLALLASGAAAGTRCLMPSWTFAASACAVRAAGLVPHFVDVEPGSWALDAASICDLARRPGVGAILVVAPFGAPLDLAAWDAVQRSTGLPVIIDAAAAFDTLREGGPMTIGACPVIVSLHATKVFGVGEGGALLARDPAFGERVQRLSNFGFLGSRVAMVPGLNGKMSEYTAAVGLAALDTWRGTRARYAAVSGQYAQGLRHSAVSLVPRFGQGWVSSTMAVLWPGDASEAVEALSRCGVGSLQWWGAGCHAQPAFHDCPREPMPVTESLARRCLGLPFWQDLTPTQIGMVLRVVAECSGLRLAPAVADLELA